MDLKNFIAEELGAMSPQEERIFDKICGICGHFQVERGEAEKLLREALTEYKHQEYNLFERTLDSVLKIFGLTTTPEHENFLKYDTEGQDTEISAHVHELDGEIKKLLEEVDTARRELNYSRSEINRLSAELNAVNSKFAAFVSETAAREKDLVSNLQQMIAMRGKDNTDFEEEPLGRILEDLGLTFTWDFEGSPECFSCFITSDPARVGTKYPAILKDDKLAAQGLVYKIEGGSNS